MKRWRYFVSYVVTDKNFTGPGCTVVRLDTEILEEEHVRRLEDGIARVAQADRNLARKPGVALVSFQLLGVEES